MAGEYTRAPAQRQTTAAGTIAAMALSPLPRFLVISLMVAAASVSGVPAGAGEPDAAEARAQIKELRERISEVQQRLAAERKRHDRAGDELAQIEQRIGRIAGELDRIDQRIAEARARLSQLEQQRATLGDELARHRDTLASQLRAAYRLGSRPGLRLLLGQDDPSAAARALGYYSYFNEARIGAMDKANALLEELASVARDTRATEQQLAADRETMSARRAELEQARGERQELLAKLEQTIASDDARLERLKERRAQLEQLLQELESVVADTPEAPLAEEPFSTLSGSLPWPVEGALQSQFGSARAEGRMQWQGLVIEAEAGTAVRAVHYGRVVFADWLSGFGQLIIIDHRQGHLTLYGFNQQLLRATGDWVAPGEVIARVGESGGREQPALYFEIRRQGKPVDPMPWLASR